MKQPSLNLPVFSQKSDLNIAFGHVSVRKVNVSVYMCSNALHQSSTTFLNREGLIHYPAVVYRGAITAFCGCCHSTEGGLLFSRRTNTVRSRSHCGYCHHVCSKADSMSSYKCIRCVVFWSDMVQLMCFRLVWFNPFSPQTSRPTPHSLHGSDLEKPMPSTRTQMNKHSGLTSRNLLSQAQTYVHLDWKLVRTEQIMWLFGYPFSEQPY